MARIAALCRAHPAPALAGAVVAVAIAAAVGYIALAPASPQPASAATAAVVNPASAESAAKARDTVIWRDETGAVYRATIGGGRFERFLRERRATLEAARTEARNQISAEIPAALKPVFAAMRARVAEYADWNFSYTTKYVLMGHALVPALDYLSRFLDRLWGPDTGQSESMIQTIASHMVDYLKEQYRERVARPREAEIRLQTAFDKSFGALQARWARIVAEQQRAMRAFIEEQAGSAERLSADQAAGLNLDWDGRRDHAAAAHQDVLTRQSYRGGLLSVTLKVHQSTGQPVKPDVKEDGAEQGDEIAHVIVNLFDKVIDPVVSQMGDLAVGIIAGSAASGTTAGFGMTGTPMMVAAGAASAAPLGAAVGLATTVVAEMLSTRLEESMTRAEFEESVIKSVAATENAINAKMIAVLNEHIEAWYVELVNPVPFK
ncbi:MAG TPA: hypothetical protein VGQ90_16695 [Stellaceae bacterium]|jgi:hypothetical protein|nr:hypothetical protein [Stellaceae bacterium]